MAASKRRIRSRYYKRLFLNDRKGIAALEADVEAHSFVRHTKKGRQRKGFSVSGDLSLTDCGRRVSLEISAGMRRNKIRYRPVLRKLARIIDTALAIRVMILNAIGKHHAWKPPRIKPKKRRVLEDIED